MDIQYTVWSCAETPFQTTVQLGGQDIQATINGLVVELLSVDGTMNRTIRVQPNDVVAAKAFYQVGATILTSDTLVLAPSASVEAHTSTPEAGE